MALAGCTTFASGTSMTTDSSSKSGDGNRDEAGRWLPGHRQPGPGRPKALDFKKLIQEHRGATYQETIIKVYDVLADKALGGDIAAIKLLLDRMTDKEADKLIVGRSLDEILAGSWERNRESEPS